MLGSILSAGASVLGGLMGQKSQEKIARQNAAMQKEFAQNGIRWKVADAQAAGIHPLAALGTNTISYSPQTIGQDSFASSIASAGQDIGRAVDATRTQGEKVDAYTQAMQALSLRRASLENDLLASKIATTRQTITPAMPGSRFRLDGQPDSGLVRTSPFDRQSTAVDAPSQEPAPVSEQGYLTTPTGWAPVMSKDAKDRLEEDMLGQLAWNLRNRLIPSLDPHLGNPPKDGKQYVYDPARQEYIEVKRGRGKYGFDRYYR